MTEYIDIFDANMNPAAPFKAERAEVNARGYWHLTFDCWVIRPTADGGKVLLQLRSTNKANNPGTLDISAAGWLQAGETKEDGLRELEEELGITADPTKLYYLGLTKEATDAPGKYIRNLCHSYFYESALALTDYKPQASEVDGLFEIGIAEGIKLFNGEVKEVEISGLVKGTPVRRMITTADMCSTHDRCVVTRYYLKIFLLAELYLEGRRPLVI